jgi:spore maturation protein CgeB
MKIVWFTHSLASCWNHGNAHFLRGILTELVLRGHEVAALEPAGGWSLANLLRDHGACGLAAWQRSYPELSTAFYSRREEAEAAVEGADLVVVHEWTDPALVAALGRMRAGGARFTLLFHDTHHRAVSDPEAIHAFDLSGYDAVLVFGEALAEVYLRWGWGRRVFVWHEAADTRRFRPPDGDRDRDRDSNRDGLVWIGNWGDGERTAEIEAYLLKPARAAGLTLDICGVRYPAEALGLLDAHGARFRGWLPNADVPGVFAAHLATVHVPRRFYARQLPGIPTIRMFEALACGIPLASAPWDDCEGLFRTGRDYLLARDPAEMTRHLRAIASDADLRADMARSALETIAARHSCAHRVDELFAILGQLGARAHASDLEALR